MEKKLEDYLPFYLGRECSVRLEEFGESVTEVLTGVVRSRDKMFCHFLESTTSYRLVQAVKPLLRPLSDMTKDEKLKFINVCGIEPEDISCVEYMDSLFLKDERVLGTAHLTNIIQWSAGVKYLLSIGVDVFKLIEAGLAIDKTKL